MAQRRIWVNRARTPVSRRGRATLLRGPRVLPLVRGFSLDILSPQNGTQSRDTTPDLTVIPRSGTGEVVDVQVEWRNSPPRLSTGSTPSWFPAPVKSYTYTGLTSGADTVITVPETFGYQRWYYRARAGNSVAGVWSDWTSPDRYLAILPTLGSVAGYIDMNVGVQNLRYSGALAYLDMNVGAQVSPPAAALGYAEMNVGVLPQWRQTTAYSDFNVYRPTGDHSTLVYSDMFVNTDRPNPHIWWIRPEQGREGYLFHIFGHGFGDFQGQHDGVVRLGNLLCPVVRWTRVPAENVPPEARIISKGTGVDPDHINVEYGWLTVVVPPGAVSALVRVILGE